MSIIYCHTHDRSIDTDYDAEHFDNHDIIGRLAKVKKNNEELRAIQEGQCSHFRTRMEDVEIGDDDMNNDLWIICEDCGEEL